MLLYMHMRTYPGSELPKAITHMKHKYEAIRLKVSLVFQYLLIDMSRTVVWESIKIQSDSLIQYYFLLFQYAKPA